jgi:hypothetical protein
LKPPLTYKPHTGLEENQKKNVKKFVKLEEDSQKLKKNRQT